MDSIMDKKIINDEHLSSRDLDELDVVLNVGTPDNDYDIDAAKDKRKVLNISNHQNNDYSEQFN
eukprot:Awhi_evm1s1604